MTHKIYGLGLRGFVIVAAIGATTHGARAAKELTAPSDSFAVTVKVDKGCSVTSPGDLSFGNQAQTPWTAKKLESSLTVKCTAGTEFALSFDGNRDPAGQSDGTRRYMISAAGDKILYYIRKSANFGDDAYGFSTGPDSVKFIATSGGDAINIPLYLTIDKDGWVGTTKNPVPLPKAGYYFDTVTAKVDF